MAIFFIVINSHIEGRYPHDSLSSPREIYNFLAFQDNDLAEQRLITELDINTSSLQISVLRRSFLIKVEIPESMLVGISGDRWINDRIKPLLRQNNIRSYLVLEDTLKTLLGEDIVATLLRTQELLRKEAQSTQLTIAALELGGNTSRALSKQVISVLDGADLIDIAQVTGEAAWNNTKPEGMLERIEKLLNPQ